MSSTIQDAVTDNVITLRGSTEIVKEFFHFSVNNILYQRGIYPPESFKEVNNYGLSMMVTTDETLQAYLDNILRQLEGLWFPSPWVLILSFLIFMGSDLNL